MLILGKVDLDTFERDGYVVVRGAVSAKVAEACRRAIWEGMGLTGDQTLRPGDLAGGGGARLAGQRRLRRSRRFAGFGHRL